MGLVYTKRKYLKNHCKGERTNTIRVVRHQRIFCKKTDFKISKAVQSCHMPRGESP